MQYKIFPPIGIARIGDSPDEYFIGPEIPGAYQHPKGGYKSADCKIKRQGARFRIFAFDDLDQPILENGRPKEITAADGQITWTVQLGNLKAASDRFYQHLGFRERNPTSQGADRDALRIVTDILSISGIEKHLVFKPGQFRGNDVPLGELRTDEEGRLIVLGGFGLSRAFNPNGTAWNKTLVAGANLYDNDDWHDDTADGPVRASLLIEGQTHTALSARVVVAPPAFAPAIQPVVTLYDRLRELMLTDFPAKIAVGKPSFNRDIHPILRRGRDVAAVYKLEDPQPHEVLHAAAEDPASPHAYVIANALRGPADGPGAGGSMPKLIDDETQGQRVRVTKQQYEAMQAWAEGPGSSNWINDWTGAPPTPDPFVTPEGMTRAALEACVGRGFRPGIEAGRWLFGMKTAGKQTVVDGVVTFDPKTYDKPTYVEPFRLADDPDAPIPPGRVTAMMAVPWQNDFNACAAENGVGWWPTHRPDQVFPEAGGPQTPWLVDDEGIGGGQVLIKNLNQFGFVVPKDGKLVSTERLVGCRELSIVLARNPLTRHQADAALANPLAKGRIVKAMTVHLDGCKPSDIGMTTFADLASQLPALAPVVTVLGADGQEVKGFTAVPTDVVFQEQNLAQAQIIGFDYDLLFTDTSAFTAGGARVVTVTGKRPWNDGMGKTGTATGDAPLTLTDVAYPYIDDGDIPWLAKDLRVFRVIQDQAPIPGAGPLAGGKAADARAYLQKVLEAFAKADPGNHPFDKLAVEQEASRLQQASTEGGKPVFNFAVARVRNPGGPLPAQGVRVFFRLFTTLSTGFDYDAQHAYRRSSDIDAPVPLLGLDGADNLITFPCFAGPRVDSAVAALTSQQDPLNLRDLPPATVGQGPSVAYYGCWIDNNQDAPQFPAHPDPRDGFWTAGRMPLNQLVQGDHHCLVAEVDYAAAPIPHKAAPGEDGRLAQRNLAWVPSDNPGGPETRTIQHSFAIKAPPRDVQRLRPDRLIIDWRGLPPGCRMRLYMPDVDAVEVLRLARTTQDYPGLARLDAHTLDCLPGGATYVPIPDGRARDIAALLTIELPEGVRKGQQFQATVRQLSAERRIQGTFQVNIPVSTARDLLPAEKRRLSILRYIALGKAPDDPWAAVLRRQIEEVAARVRGYGGDPDAIAPSSAGDGEAGKGKAFVCRMLAVLFALALAMVLLTNGLHPLPPWLLEIASGLATVVFGLLWLLVCKPPPWRILLAAGAGAVLGAGLLGIASLIGHGSPVLPAWLAASAVAGAVLLGLGALLKPKP